MSEVAASPAPSDPRPQPTPTAPPVEPSNPTPVEPAGPSENGSGQGEAPPGTTVTFSGAGDGAVGVGLEVPGSPAKQSSSTPGPVSYGPKCNWRRASLATSLPPSDVVTFDPETDQTRQFERHDGAFAWWRTCPGKSPEFVWQQPVNPIDLLPGAHSKVVKKIPIPEPNMNPAPEIGALVQVGLWISIADPGTTTARGTLGRAWAEETATFSHLIVDFGNGDQIRCDNLGVPIERVHGNDELREQA